MSADAYDHACERYVNDYAYIDDCEDTCENERDRYHDCACAYHSDSANSYACAYVLECSAMPGDLCFERVFWSIIIRS